MTKITPSYAIVFNFIFMAVAVAGELFLLDQPNDQDVRMVVFLVLILTALPSLIASSILHYRCWSSIPSEIARTTPGLAVGLLFVPFFNFYWCFVSYQGLAEDCATTLRSKGSWAGLGITLGILSITSTTILINIPLLIIPIEVASFIVWLIYTFAIVASCNEIVNTKSAITSRGTEESLQTAD